MQNLLDFRLNSQKSKILQEIVEELLQKGHIQERMSPCAAFALLTPKNNVSWRMCVNNRAIHKITVGYKFLIHWLNDIFDQLHATIFFLKTNLKIGHHQIV